MQLAPQNTLVPAARACRSASPFTGSSTSEASGQVQVSLERYERAHRKLQDLDQERNRNSGPPVVLGGASYVGKTQGGVLALAVQLDVTLTTHGVGLKATAESVSLPAPIGQLKAVELLCDEVIISSGAQFQCQQGELSFKQQDIGQQTVQFKIDVDTDRKTYHITTSGLSLASSKLAFDLHLVQRHWQLKARSSRTSIKQFRRFILPYLS